MGLSGHSECPYCNGNCHAQQYKSLEKSPRCVDHLQSVRKSDGRIWATGRSLPARKLGIPAEGTGGRQQISPLVAYPPGECGPRQVTICLPFRQFLRVAPCLLLRAIPISMDCVRPAA